MSEQPMALFFDVDGTIIWYKPGADVDATVATAVPSPAVAEAFHALSQRGHHPFICTGRSLTLVSDKLLSLDVDGLVTADGACVSVGGEVVSDEVVPAELLIDVARRAYEADSLIMFEGSRACVALVPKGMDYRNAMGVGVVHSVEEFAGTGDLRFSKFVLQESDRARLMTPENRAFFDEHFEEFALGLPVYEMTLKGMNKGAGVRRVLEMLGIGPERAIAFGDSENDLSMADAVGTFVAMGNAMPGVKEVADYVTDPVEHDGVVTALQHFGLI